MTPANRSATRSAVDVGAVTVIARTDALSVLGIDEAVRRAAAYADAGADLVFVATNHSVYQRIGLTELRRLVGQDCVVSDIWNIFGTDQTMFHLDAALAFQRSRSRRVAAGTNGARGAGSARKRVPPAAVSAR